MGLCALRQFAKMRSFGIAGVAACVVGLGAAPLRAEYEPKADANGITQPSLASSLPQGGDPYGARKWLADHGISYTLIYTNDVLSNLSGGTKRGTINQGKLDTQLTIDLEKLAGWKGLTFYTNSFVTHNTGRIRRDYVG